MTSLAYLTNEFISSCLDNSIEPNLYENNNIEKRIYDFIEEKAEVYELLRLHPAKKRKLFGFLIIACIEIKMSQLLGLFLESSEEGVKYCFINQCEGMTRRQISGYKRKIQKFTKNVFNNAIKEIKKILVEEGNIEEILELVFEDATHCDNLQNFMRT